MTRDDRLWVCVLTPPGRGAVATVAVQGTSAATAIGQFFQSTTAIAPTAMQSGPIYHGRWCSKSAGEEVVVSRAAADRFDIHSHGGAAAPRAIVADLVTCGAKEVTWQAWLSRETSDRLTREATIALTEARTERTAAILIDQYHGALAQELRGIAADLERGELGTAATRLQVLRDRSPVGLHLTRPFRVVLAGAPNVGKSSLINALVGYQRSIVHGQPGTTRDVVTAVTAIEGWPVELSDTAGLRTTDDAIEAAGVATARARLATADLIVLVFDAREADALLPSWCSEWTTSLVVANKRDLLVATANLPPSIDVATSATTGAGIESLVDAIGRRLVPHPPTAGEPVPFTTEQFAALDTALAAIEARDAALALAAFAPWL